MPELIPVIVTLEVTKLERRLVAIDLDDLERDLGTREPVPGLLAALIKATPNWQQRFGADDGNVLEIDVVDAQPQPVQAGEPPR